jgi:diguanylate cyclase (GGDEF)-like protein
MSAALTPRTPRPVRVMRAHRDPPDPAPGADPAGDPLRFSSKVESEFRAWYYASHVQRARISLPLAQVLVFASIGLDLIGASGAPQRWAALVKLLLISPLLLATLWISRQPRYQHLYPHFMCASIIAVGAAFTLINTGTVMAPMGVGVEVRYDALVLVTVFTYFLGGLASTFASATGLALLALHIFLAATKNMPLDEMAYKSLFLLAINAVGMLSANMTEQSVREAFWRFQTMTQLSEVDPLTQLLNRRGFDRRYAELWEQAQRERKTVALAFVDLDHFKSINDQHGHDAGDAALRAVAGVLERESDPRPALCARLGGDELVAVWYDIDRPRAELIAARIPRAVEQYAVEGAATSGGLTVSVGLSVCQPSANALAGDCLRRADQALYEAKQRGRNRLAVA